MSIHLWTILMISIQVLCHVDDLMHGFVTSLENVLFTLENIGTCVKITWNYFPCLVLHKVKVFIDYAQGLVQLLVLIFTSIISFLHCLSSWKTVKAVNYKWSEIIGLIHLKYGKRMACRECSIFPRSREKVNNGSLILTCLYRPRTPFEGPRPLPIMRWM